MFAILAAAREQGYEADRLAEIARATLIVGIALGKAKVAHQAIDDFLTEPEVEEFCGVLKGIFGDVDDLFQKGVLSKIMGGVQAGLSEQVTSEELEKFVATVRTKLDYEPA